MSGVVGLFIETGVIVGIIAGIIGLLAGRPLIRAARLKARSAELSYTARADWARMFTQQRNAIASMLSEIETHPATYETLPEDIREQLLAAHQAGSDISRRNHIS